ncbi:MAG: helix-turn-helix domain-containing protein [Actinomycetia bacterium]|nr:helix-turn-helix domain-containing protein [Actinomycetes bacterium]
MATRRSEILLHPVRLRIVLATAGDEVTTADIAKQLPDVPQATLYRHIAKLTDAGILDVVGERQARGAIERTYRVNATKASIGTAEASKMSADEHFEAFTTFAGALIESYGRYLNTPGSEPAADGVSFRQARLWLTDHELDALVTDVTTALARYLDFNKTHERTPRLLSTILMPEPEPTDD